GDAPPVEGDAPHVDGDAPPVSSPARPPEPAFESSPERPLLHAAVAAMKLTSSVEPRTPRPRPKYPNMNPHFSIQRRAGGPASRNACHVTTSRKLGLLVLGQKAFFTAERVVW
ncbi:MAG TPA: hypothetical protein VLJ38_06005, partial [Polyangiaceae bacterium]|nr:hypothetical protein [Polyangiaceae bacterium]